MNSSFSETQHCVWTKLSEFPSGLQIVQGFSRSVCAFVVMVLLLCGLFLPIESLLQFHAIHYIIFLLYTSSSIPHSFSRLDQRQWPAASRQTIIVFNPVEETEDHLVVCGNISHWVSQTPTHRACMASPLSSGQQAGHCPECVCLHLCERVLNRSVVSYMQLLTSVSMKALDFCLCLFLFTVV